MRLSLSGAKRSLAHRVAIAAAGLALGSTMAVASATSASAAIACKVTYSPNQWPGGMSVNLTIDNLGDPLNGWTLTFTFPDSGQKITQGWSANWSQQGRSVTATSLDWNSSVPSGGSVSIGFNGTWTTSNPSPNDFKVNGVACTGQPSSPPPSSPPPSSPPPSSPPPSSPPPSSPPPSSPPPTGGRVDNPYEGADGYVNPEWRANALSEPGGSRVANTSTAVWLDRIAAIEGASGKMGLREHLDEAVQQDAANGSKPLTIQIVIYDLPNRDCSALASNGELLVSQNGLNRYKSEYIDPIAQIMSDSKYRNLRIVAIIEPDSLPNLITNVNSFEKCREAQQSGAYVQGVQYAINKLRAIPNVYIYVDAAHHGWLGWDSNFNPAVDLFYSTIAGTERGVDSVDGFIVNTANYSATVEPYFNINTTVNGVSVRQSKWVDWNQYVDEQSYALALRRALISKGFKNTIGMLIDTSRNGWGGPDRPTGPSSATDVNKFVDESRIDRRIHAGNWCNQAGAGLGERPRANPAPGIDAYVWVKPPGESDGASEEIPNDEGKSFDRMCDPTYEGNSLNGYNKTGALPNAPISGHWFSAQFQELMRNAYPPLD